MESDREKRLILWFDDIIIDDVALVGGKTASLGEMYQKLISQGVNVPWGFAITRLCLPVSYQGGPDRGDHKGCPSWPQYP